MTNTEKIITNKLFEIGVPCSIKGFDFLKLAIEKVLQDKKYLSAVTKNLYPEIAKEFGTTSSRVERAIRHAIEVAFDNGNNELLLKLFANLLNKNTGKPTNSEFIAKIARIIEMESEE